MLAAPTNGMACKLQGEYCTVDFAQKKIGCHCNVDQKITSSFIYGQSSTDLANFVKIGPVDVEIIGLTEITKILF